MSDGAENHFDAQAFLRTVPKRAGVYRMIDRHREVLYVGKARNLHRRLSSWLRGGARDAKGRAMLQHTVAVEVTVTHTETEALLLENNLIKEHRPRYNIILRDDKSYPWIRLTGDAPTARGVFQRFTFHRGTRRRSDSHFGPYSNAGAVRQTIALMQKLFRVRQCTDAFFRNRTRPCLQYQIERCSAPCVGLISQADYARDVRHAVMFLEGRSEAMIEELVERMEEASGALEFELAARYRDQIKGLRRVQERQYVDGAKGNIDVVAVRREKALGVVQVLAIRNGQNLGSHTRVPRNIRGASEEEILEAFLAQYYLSDEERRVLPDRIVLDRVLPNPEPFEEALARQAGRRVEIGMGRRGHRARWVSMARENAEVAIRRQLLDHSTLNQRFQMVAEALKLERPPERIECFDISHTDGEATVASCVVFGPEGPEKSAYRRFNIRGVTPGDDYEAMEQALFRRFAGATAKAGVEEEQDGEGESVSRATEEERDGNLASLPDLLLIDGGRGQLDRALNVISELALSGVEVAAVAKGTTRKPGFEQIHLPGARTPLMLPEDSPALHLIQQVRDEAHRFAITGHRAQRNRRRRTSTLESLPGVGPVLRRRLLVEFGGLPGLRRAGVEDLARVKGISPRIARTVYEFLQEVGG